LAAADGLGPRATTLRVAAGPGAFEPAPGTLVCVVAARRPLAGAGRGALVPPLADALRAAGRPARRLEPASAATECAFEASTRASPRRPLERGRATASPVAGAASRAGRVPFADLRACDEREDGFFLDSRIRAAV
jgi:hypothetical protein